MHGTRKFGAPVTGWTPPTSPGAITLEGRYCRLEPLDADAHAALLFRAFEGHDDLWDYLPYGPFASAAQYHRWVRQVSDDPGLRFFAIVSRAEKRPLGVASFLRIDPASGSIEIGHICLSPDLQRTPVATEAFFLMMQWAFEAGYRRFEWKCDALNLPSRRAGQRIGLSFEGVFHQATIVKGRNRDTAWFAAIDAEWPALREAFSVWLAPANFDADGRQRERLSDLTGLIRVTTDPALGR
jgi:RimJ/RimL family protein N-acetyltransferase